MRKYGKIETGFWQNRKVRKLPEDGRLLLLYLLTCPHGNAAGCFVLPLAYVMHDLTWSEKRAAAATKKLLASGLIERDDDHDMVRVVGWWGHNAIENPNVGKHVASLLLGLAKTTVRAAAISEFIATDSFGKLPEGLQQSLRDGSETVTGTLSKPSRNKEPNLDGDGDGAGAEKRTRSRAGGGYEFEGSVIRLTAKDFNEWKRTFHAIPDLRAELTVIDAKFLGEAATDKWFGKASAWLRSKHERLLAEAKRKPPDGVHPMLSPAGG